MLNRLLNEPYISDDYLQSLFSNESNLPKMKLNESSKSIVNKIILNKKLNHGDNTLNKYANLFNNRIYDIESELLKRYAYCVSKKYKQPMLKMVSSVEEIISSIMMISSKESVVLRKYLNDQKIDILIERIKKLNY